MNVQTSEFRSSRLWQTSVLILLASQVLGQTPTSASEPSLAISRAGGQVEITFSGVLQFAEEPAGPWITLSNAVSPYVSDASGYKTFYRAQSFGTASIFSSTSVVALTLTGPLQDHFELALAGLPDGIFPPVREKPWFEGTVGLPGWNVPASLRVRGNSSLQECPFPKLKFKISRSDREGTPFADAREVKIATHCAEGGYGSIGRLRDQIATFREAIAYELMAAMDFIAPRLRRARIEYRDTTPPSQAESEVGWQLSRDAMIFEDIEVIAERLGARVLPEEELETLEGDRFDPQLVTELLLLHALLGNWDYQLAWQGRGVWNTEVLEFTSGTDVQLVPVAGDFDLASLVTGVPLLSAPHFYHPEMPELERETLYRVDLVQQYMTPANFTAARDRFRGKRAVLEAVVASAQVDTEGRALAVRHLNAFYAALDFLK